MYLNQLFDNYGARHRSKLLGRGIGSGKGKTSGRGGKGQTARSGVSINGFEGGQTPLIKRLPKRGFRSRNKIYYNLVSFNLINELVEREVIKAGSLVNKEVLYNAGIIKSTKNVIKLVGQGELKYAINFAFDKYTKTALDKVKALGGSTE